MGVGLSLPSDSKACSSVEECTAACRQNMRRTWAAHRDSTTPSAPANAATSPLQDEAESLMRLLAHS